MSDNTFTLENALSDPASVVTYAITDAGGNTVKLSVMQGQVVQHPVDSSLSPWVVTSEINTTGTIDIDPQTIYSPTATLSTSAIMVADPSLAQGGIPGGKGVSGPSVFSDAQWEAVGDRVVPAFAPSQATRLPFNIQPQSQTQWCWAAVTSTVSGYYLGSPSPDFTQCKLANFAFGASNNCCSTPGSSACNQPWSLRQALTHTGNLETMLERRLAFSEVKAQIDGNHPAGVRIQWASGTGHFVALRGYDTAGSLIDISDPWQATTTTMNIDDFPAHYPSGSGTWTHSYRTKAA